MAIHEIQVIRITEDPDSGRMEIGMLWNGQEFSATYDSRARMVEVAQDPVQSQDAAIGFALAWWLARDPDGSNEDRILNKVIKVDFSDAVPIKVN